MGDEDTRITSQQIAEDTRITSQQIAEDTRITSQQIAEALDISSGSVLHILKDKLQYRKVSARFIPYILKPKS